MASRPTVSVYNASSAKNEVAGTVPLPGVFSAPLRHDVINYVHTQMAKNRRQAYSVNAEYAGMNPAAISWGTGRAVSRIPRVPGGGTSASGSGAFGNMCRGGRMFNPTRIWRRWHRKISVGQRRYAVSSAIAATGITSLVMARGHRVNNVPELPLVLAMGEVNKSSDLLSNMRNYGIDQDIEKAKESRTLRAGHGKARNRRYVARKGPLIVVGSKNLPTTKAIRQGARNLPGVEVCAVDSLNLLQLAPGGHMGRLVVWTKDAFEQLDALFGTAPGAASSLKRDFTLPRSSMTTPDVARIINSDEIQKVLRPKKPRVVQSPRKRNPLRNKRHLLKLNPYADVVIRAEQRKQEQAKVAKTSNIKKREAAAPVAGGDGGPNKKKQRLAFVRKLLSTE
jgi:large subunit ribosomal protein L4e